VTLRASDFRLACTHSSLLAYLSFLRNYLRDLHFEVWPSGSPPATRFFDPSFRQVSTFSPAVTTEMTALRKMTQEVSEAIQRMTHLAQGSPPNGADATETSTSSDGKKSEQYFASQIEMARSFLSVYPGAAKVVAQGEAKRHGILSRLRDERQGTLFLLDFGLSSH
jgi:hypothetical protein